MQAKIAFSLSANFLTFSSLTFSFSYKSFLLAAIPNNIFSVLSLTILIQKFSNALKDASFVIS